MRQRFKSKKFTYLPSVAVARRYFVKIGMQNLWKRCVKNFPKFTGKHLRRIPFLINVTPVSESRFNKVYKFSEIFKNTFFIEHHLRRLPLYLIPAHFLGQQMSIM